MEKNEFINLLRVGFESNDLGTMLSSESETKLYQLYATLVETNKVTNLTAITDPKGVILKHFIDCATVSKHIPKNSKLIDVGCGAGFPSLPLAILREDVSVTSLDSTGKKIDFINKTASDLCLDNVNAVCARAEDFVENKREMYDVCVSRAVARMNILAELCIPLVKVGGFFVPMKSNKGDEELKEAENGIKKLGCEIILKDSKELSLSDDTIIREIFVFSKTNSTPKCYPRKYPQIVKKPL